MRLFDPANIYTPEEVQSALKGTTGVRNLSFRFERLGPDNALLGEISHIADPVVENNSLADIKRTMKFAVRDDSGINFLSDRIKPYVRLQMPPGPSTWGPGSEVRRNLVTNPSHETGTGAWTSDDGLPTNTVSYPSDGGAFGTRYARRTFTANDNAIEGGIRYDHASPVVGETYTYSVYVRVSVAQRIQTRFTFVGAGVADSFGEAVDVPANTWTRLSQTATIPAGTTTNRFKLRAVSGGSGHMWQIGETLDQDAALIEVGSTLGPYFDGSTADTTSAYYSWAGTADASESIQLGAVEVPDPRRGYVEWPQGVFLLSSPSRSYRQGALIMREVQAYDQLLVLRDDRVTDRYTVTAGTNYVTAIQTLVSGLGFTTNMTPTTKTLPVSRDWDPGTSKLEILNELLGAINYESAFFDEDGVLVGRPYISPANRASEYTYAADSMSMIYGDVEHTLDLFAIPNKWTIVVSNADQTPISSTYTNTSISSPTSTVNRGRTIVDFRTEQDAADQATLDAMVARLAFEASQVYEIVEFETPIMPIHQNADVYSLDIDGLDINSTFSEHTWSMPLTHGATMSHKVRKVTTV